jgi:hypothetical protein
MENTAKNGTRSNIPHLLQSRLRRRVSRACGPACDAQTGTALQTFDDVCIAEQSACLFCGSKRGNRDMAPDGRARTSCRATGVAVGEVFASMFVDPQDRLKDHEPHSTVKAPGTVFSGLNTRYANKVD